MTLILVLTIAFTAGIGFGIILAMLTIIRWMRLNRVVVGKLTEQENEIDRDGGPGLYWEVGTTNISGG